MSSSSASSASLPTKAGANLPPADADDLDGLGDALQAHLAWFGEQKFARLGRVPAGEHLAIEGRRSDAGGLVNTLAAIVESHRRRRRLVHPDPNRGCKSMGPAMVGQGSLDLHGALDGTIGLIETRENTVPAVADFLAG